MCKVMEDVKGNNGNGFTVKEIVVAMGKDQAKFNAMFLNRFDDFGKSNTAAHNAIEAHINKGLEKKVSNTIFVLFISIIMTTLGGFATYLFL